MLTFDDILYEVDCIVGGINDEVKRKQTNSSKSKVEVIINIYFFG